MLYHNIIFYCTVANLVNYIVRDKVATTYLIDSIVYMYLTYKYFLDVSMLNVLVPYSEILDLYATTLIGAILWHKKLPTLMLVHHVLSSTFILWFNSSYDYKIEAMLSCYYCMYVMGLDFIEFIHMSYKRLGHDISRTIRYVRYYDMLTKIYGNISILYIINMYEWNVSSRYSKLLSNILIVFMFYIQLKANKHIR